MENVDSVQSYDTFCREKLDYSIALSYIIQSHLLSKEYILCDHSYEKTYFLISHKFDRFGQFFNSLGIALIS